MSKIKETKQNNEFAGKERERRNRKMLVDQRAIQEKLDVQKHETDLINKLLKTQATEQKEAMDRLRQDRCMAIRFNNRKRAAEEADAKK